MAGSVDAEVAGRRSGGVQVEDGVHAGLADGVEVHEVAVVGDEVVVGAERVQRSSVVGVVVGSMREVEVVAGEGAA